MVPNMYVRTSSPKNGLLTNIKKRIDAPRRVSLMIPRMGPNDISPKDGLLPISDG